MSQEALGHNYAGSMEELGLAIGALFADVGTAIAAMDAAATTLGTLITQVTTVKETVEKSSGKITTAAEHLDDAGEAITTGTVIKPEHPEMQMASGAAMESMSALEVADDKHMSAEEDLETEATTLNERKTLIEADSAALKEFVRQGQAFGTAVTGAANDARPAW